MLKGTCPQCGSVYYGWALKNPEHQDCIKCGSWLEISEGAPECRIGVSEPKILEDSVIRRFIDGDITE